MYKFPYLSLSLLGSDQGEGLGKGNKKEEEEEEENHCNATHLGLALVTNVSMFWGYPFLFRFFSSPCLCLKRKIRNRTTFQRSS